MNHTLELLHRAAQHPLLPDEEVKALLDELEKFDSSNPLWSTIAANMYGLQRTLRARGYTRQWVRG
jgi:uncharacterized FAD-dependent dehydrogenase